MAGKRVSSGRALKYLFASGILKGRGSGKNRTVTYDKSRAQSLSRLRKRGVDTTVKQKHRNTPGKSGRHVFGAKAAHLRGSGTGSGQTGAKRMLLNPQRHDGSRKASGPAPANIKFPASKSAAPASSKGNPAHAATRAARLAAAQKVLGKSKAAQYVADMRRYQGMSPGIAAHARAIAAKQRVTTLKKRLTKLQRDNGTGGKPKVDHSATRAKRLAAGHAIANRPEVARKALKGSGLRVTEHKDKGPRILGAGVGPLKAVGKKTNMAGDTRFLVQTARKSGQLKPRWSRHGATRAERIDAGRMEAAYQVHRLAYKHKATATAVDSAKRGMAQMANSSLVVQRIGFGDVKSAAAAVQRMQRKERTRRRAASR